MASDQSMALGAPAISANGSAPHCEHLDGLAPAAPQSGGCRDCQAHAESWTSLLVCLTCGWVACGNDSPGRHAKAHYEETDHPIAAAADPGPGRRWRWCYVHQRQV